MWIYESMKLNWAELADNRRVKCKNKLNLFQFIVNIFKTKENYCNVVLNGIQIVQSLQSGVIRLWTANGVKSKFKT